jgi:hypothetical protein
MRYRALELADLPDVLRLYRLMLDEGMAQMKGRVRYPHPDPETTPGEMQAYLFQKLTTGDPYWIARVAVIGGAIGPEGVRGGRPKGMAMGTLYPRPIGQPRWVGHCDLLFVDPKFRGGRGEKAIAVRLLSLLAEEARARIPGCVLEGSYVPGTHGERLWPRLGLVPYLVMCAFVDEKGQPREPQELFAHRVKPGATVKEATTG